jgi:two-component system, NtrC family, sensor kinase
VRPVDRERIFLPFFTTKPLGSGMGLGLSTAYALAQASGGVVYLDTTVEHTRFVMHLPMPTEQSESFPLQKSLRA